MPKKRKSKYPASEPATPPSEPNRTSLKPIVLDLKAKQSRRKPIKPVKDAKTKPQKIAREELKSGITLKSKKLKKKLVEDSKPKPRADLSLYGMKKTMIEDYDRRKLEKSLEPTNVYLPRNIKSGQNIPLISKPVKEKPKQKPKRFKITPLHTKEEMLEHARMQRKYFIEQQEKKSEEIRKQAKEDEKKRQLETIKNKEERKKRQQIELSKMSTWDESADPEKNRINKSLKSLERAAIKHGSTYG
jgi:hypothetical protein